MEKSDCGININTQPASEIAIGSKPGIDATENLQTLAKEINIGKSNLDMFQNE